MYEVNFPDLDVLAFRYAVIQLNRLEWRQFLKFKNPVASVLMAKMQIAREERLHVKLECLKMLAMLKLDPARKRMISGFIDTYLRLTEEETKVFMAKVGALSEPEEREGVMEIVQAGWKKELSRGSNRGGGKRPYRWCAGYRIGA